jgi:spermidine/putrescine transport system ATP-binding protein
VALARALVMQPEVLLLDEPLGALDMKLRKEMQVELKNLQEQLKITFIFVTHDQEEALVMSDRIAVMNQGKIEQVGKSCSEIYEHPRTEFVANFIGSTNIFEGVLRDRILKMNGGPEFHVDSARQGPVRFTVRPEKMLLSPQEVAGRISIPVVVTDEIFQGTNTSWVVDFHGQKYTVIEQNTKVVEEQGRFSRGDQALLSWNPKHTVILES